MEVGPLYCTCSNLHRRVGRVNYQASVTLLASMEHSPEPLLQGMHGQEAGRPGTCMSSLKCFWLT